MGRSVPQLLETCDAVRALGRRALMVVGDLSRLEDIDRSVHGVVSEFGRVDVLVNNASLAGRLAPSVEYGPEEFDKIVQVNLRGIFFLTTLVAREMMRGSGGSIINITSALVRTAAPYASVYIATKAAVEALTRTWAVEWARHRIRVNAVAPGYTRTSMIEEVLSNERWASYIRDRTPLARVADPEEIVGAVVYLASEASSFQTGQVICVDGGWSIR
jgi:NAD(P)-dependent dehydrogenase (short-subunit alcohol dehydrogenase family)